MDESSTSGTKGLFGFLSSRDGADKSGQSFSDVWELSQDQSSRGAVSLRPGSSQQGSKWFLNPELLPPQPSPAVMRTRTESHALRRKSGASEKIQTAERSLRAIREVVSSTHPPPTTQPYPSYTPGSLLKESFRHPSRSSEATPPGHTPIHFTPLTGTPLTTPASSRREPETPKASLSIMDESGMTRELFMAATPTRDVTVLEPSRVTHMTLFEDTVLGQPETTMMEDPQQKAASELVTSFHRCVSAHPNPASVLELVGELEKAVSLSRGGRRLSRPVHDSDEEKEGEEEALQVSTDKRALDHLMLLQSILNPFMEAYWSTATALAKLDTDTVEESQFLRQLQQSLLEKAKKGLLNSVESCSMDTLWNAVKTFADMEMVSYGNGGTLYCRDNNRLLELAETLTQFRR